MRSKWHPLSCRTEWDILKPLSYPSPYSNKTSHMRSKWHPFCHVERSETSWNLSVTQALTAIRLLTFARSDILLSCRAQRDILKPLSYPSPYSNKTSRIRSKWHPLSCRAQWDILKPLSYPNPYINKTSHMRSKWQGFQGRAHSRLLTFVRSNRESEGTRRVEGT